MDELFLTSLSGTTHGAVFAGSGRVLETLVEEGW